MFCINYMEPQESESTGGGKVVVRRGLGRGVAGFVLATLAIYGGYSVVNQVAEMMQRESCADRGTKELADADFFTYANLNTLAYELAEYQPETIAGMPGDDAQRLLGEIAGRARVIVESDRAERNRITSESAQCRENARGIPSLLR